MKLSSAPPILKHGTDDKYPLFYWNSIQAHDFKHISRVISNLSIERAAELKKYSSATRGTLFCRGSILLTIYASKKGGGMPKDDMLTRGGGGVSIPPKSDDVIYEQPLRLHAPQIIYGDGRNFQNHWCLWTSTWWYLRDQHRELKRKDGTVQCDHKSISVAFRRHCFGCKRLVCWPTQVILLPPRMSRGSFIPVLPAVHTFNLLVVPILTSKS